MSRAFFILTFFISFTCFGQCVAQASARFTTIQPVKCDTIITVTSSNAQYPEYKFHVCINGDKFYLGNDNLMDPRSYQLVYRFSGDYEERFPVLRVIPADPHSEYHYTHYQPMFNGIAVPLISSFTLNIIKKDQRAGLITGRGEVKLNFAYDSIVPIDSPQVTFVLYRNGKKGYYKDYAYTWADNKPEFFYEPENDSISDIGWYNDRFYHTVKVRNKWRQAGHNGYIARGRYDSIVIPGLMGVIYAKKGRKWAPVSPCGMYMDKRWLSVRERIGVYRCLHRASFKWDSIGTIDQVNLVCLVKKNKKYGLSTIHDEPVASAKWSLIVCPSPGVFEFYSKRKGGGLYLEEVNYWDKKKRQLTPVKP